MANKLSSKSRKRKYPPLTKEQQKLVEDHLWIAGKLTYSASLHTRGFTGCFTKDDLESIARFALCVAATRYNPDLGWKFSTYAWNTARGYIQHALRDYSRIVRVPRWVMLLREEVRSRIAKGIPYSEISKELNLSQEQIFLCEQSWKEIHKSYDHYSEDTRQPEFTYEIDFIKDLLGKELLFELGNLSDSEISFLLNYFDNNLSSEEDIEKAEKMLESLRQKVKSGKLSKVVKPNSIRYSTIDN
jgi:DNA-directed RNA polymerase specialized sigma subunit